MVIVDLKLIKILKTFFLIWATLVFSVNMADPSWSSSNMQPLN